MEQKNVQGVERGRGGGTIYYRRLVSEKSRIYDIKYK